ncbi:MAG: S8 family serine peptidase [Eubacterium sp.]|nr:S8 family serine peptidase [Eubacterium sp.]
MKMKIIKRIIGSILIVAMMLSSSVCIYSKNLENNLVEETNYNEQSKEYYVIDCNSKRMYDKVRNLVKEEAANDSVILEENNVIVLQLSEDTKEKLTDLGVSIEYDECVDGSAYKDKTRKKDKDRDDWNMRSIEVVPEDQDAGREKIKIAVIDSGIDFNESINVVERKNFLDDEVSPLHEDNTGHGTAIAGIIASNGCDKTVKGINPNAEIYSARVLDSNNKAPISRVVEAIYWAIDNDVKIINMSFGTKTYSKVLHNAIKEAEQKGILMFAASGNGGKSKSGNVEYPAAFKEVIGVGSASKNGKMSEITSTGKELELVAPGEDIDSVGWLGLDVSCNGTSIAVPHAVGAASLLWQKDLTKPAQFIRDLMKISSKTILDNNGDRYSYIDYTYAEEIYDDLYHNYKNKGNAAESNKKYKNKGKVKSYEGEVEARWSKTNHGNTVEYANDHAGGLTSTQIEIVKLGAKAPDVHCPATVYPSHRMLHALGNFNYVKVYEQIMNMSLRCRKYGHSSALSMGYPDGYPGDFNECETVRSWLGVPEIKVMLNNQYVYNDKNAALIMMGVAMHVIGDTYAHKSYALHGTTWVSYGSYPYKGEGKFGEPKEDGTYNRADDTDCCRERFICAKKACTEVLAVWNGNCPPSFCEYIQNHADIFRLERLYSFSKVSWNGIDFNSYSNKLFNLSFEFY